MSDAAASMDVRPLSRLFKALGDETRLRIVALLTRGELCVCHLEAALGIPQPTVSRQLAVLRSAGVVESRREGTWVYSRLVRQQDAMVRGQLEALVASLGRRRLRQDVERLLKAKGPGACK